MVQMIRSAQHGGVACYSAELRLCSGVLQHLEFAGWGQRGVYSHVPFFLGRWCEGKHGCVGVGASTEIKKESSYMHSQPTCVGIWKVKCMENNQEVASQFEPNAILLSCCFQILHVTDIFITFLKKLSPH